MSAIWGVIDFKGNPIEQSIKDIYAQTYDKCVIDRTEAYEDEGIYLVNGIQYITDTAHMEKGPIEEDGLIFASDAIVDNCRELRDMMGMDAEEDISDGEILRRHHIRYGEQGLDNPRGAYAYITYNHITRTAELVADALGVRYFYYFFENNRIYFSTLLEPLTELKREVEPNKTWIANYLKQDNLGIYIEGEETSVEGILRVGPAGYVKVTLGDEGFNVEKHRYWDPAKIKSRIRYKSNEQYRKAFRDLYEDCVRCVLRSSGETAILLSGGYDSTSVAVLAAPMLDKMGKKLYSYTSVPMSGYENDCDRDQMPDETDAVKKTVEQYPMIEPTFMDLPNMNPWRDRLWYSEICELPYKSAENMLWLYAGSDMAAKAGCKIILTGSFGNGTVSYSNLKVYMSTLVRHFRWVKLLQLAKGFQKRYNISRKLMMKDAFRGAFTSASDKELRAVSEDAIYNAGTVDKYCSTEWFEREIRINKRFEKNARLHQLAFFPIGTIRQYSEYAVKHSLYTGVVNRDPTRDKRLMEFVLGLPQDQFTHDGLIRALISDYMSDVMPRYILSVRKQGAQSADMRQRIGKDWDAIKAELMACFDNHRDSEWIDCDKALRQLKEHNYEKYGNFDLLRLMYSAMLLEYLDGFKVKQ